MMQCSPFLLFDGNCSEVITFYHECLGGALTLTKLGDTPMKDMFPPEKHDRIINAHLKSGEIENSATDWMASPDFDPIFGNSFAIYVTSDSNEDLERVFENLKDGDNNERLQELREMPFGTYGQFFDKYGIQWIFRGEKKV
jgi:PhnB protein